MPYRYFMSVSHHKTLIDKDLHTTTSINTQAYAVCVCISGLKLAKLRHL